MGGLTVIDRAGVWRCLARLDPVGVVEDVLRAHARGSVLLPAEGYLPWTDSAGAACRSLAMLGGLLDGAVPAMGVKIINAAVRNPANGLERAGGVGLLFDPETARPVVMMEAGLLSAIRTAAYTVVSLCRLAPARWERTALIGTGTLARAHLRLLVDRWPDRRDLVVFDALPERAERFRAWATERHPGIRVAVAPTAGDAARASQVVVTTTTSTTPYLGPDAFSPGTLVAHVSLDDVQREVFERAEGIVVDDIDLVRDNPRRILGALLASGHVRVPGPAPSLAQHRQPAAARPIDATLGEVIVGAHPGVRPTTGVVVSNPFGMAILDIGLYRAVAAAAAAEGIGTAITLTEEEDLW